MEAQDHGAKLGPEWRRHLRTMQIIAAALVLGPVLFAAVVLVTFQAASDALELLGKIGLGFAAVTIGMSVIVPGMIGKLKETSSTQQYLGVYQTRLIIKLALLESAAFINIVALQAEQSWWSLGAAGFVMILMIAGFPTASKIEFWMQAQKEMSSLG
tara:strand:+ start:989 stop:1459 length:471 start_codon:yes stop_codon:yes gene_type:complete